MDDKWIENIKDRMSEFEMTPPEGLWDSINKEIRQRKFRRWRIWAVTASVSAAIIAGLYFIFTSYELKLTQPLAPTIISDVYDSNEDAIEKGKENDSFARETSILSHKKNGNMLYSSATRKDKTDLEITTEEIIDTKIEDTPQLIEELSKKERSDYVTRQSDIAETKNDKTSAFVELDEHTDDSHFSYGASILANGIGSYLNSNSLNDHITGKSSNSTLPLTRMGGGLVSDSPIYGDPLVPTPTAVEVYDHKLPLRFSIGFSFFINKKFSIDSGITYSFLKSDIRYRDKSTIWNGQQQLHFIGIPVGVRYTPFRISQIDFYASAGIMVEKCIAGTLKSDKSSIVSYHYDGCEDRPFMFSLNTAVGLQYNFSKECGIYLEPGLGYYLKNNSKLRTIYSERPVTFNINIGVRIGNNIGQAIRFSK